MHNQKKDNNKFKTKNKQNCQRIKLHGSLTTKELNKKHLSRLVGGVKKGSQGKVVELVGEVVVGRLGGPTIACG